MTDNHDISDVLSLYAKLYELHGGNPFKVKSIAAAAFNIKKLAEPLEGLSEAELTALPQVGRNMAPKVYGIIQNGSFPELEQLLADTPEGVQQLLRVKGLGPKKVELLWKQHQIASIPELLDACRENRLVELKGFGYKTQAQIMSDIEFKFSNEGKYHWARMQAVVTFIDSVLEQEVSVSHYSCAGDYRRMNDVVEKLEYVVVCKQLDILSEALCAGGNFELCDAGDNYITLLYAGSLNVWFYATSHERWGNALLEHTATENHLKAIGYVSEQDFEDEESVYAALNLPFVLPELREGRRELEVLDKQDKLIVYKDLKGVLHNHTTYSDGLHSLEEMANAARMMGMEYIGICDHSQTAGYANGLKPERVLQQMKEIDALNEKMAPFKIFKGIESDILGDGSLDYTADILRMFDLVVASVHSNLAMDAERANQRLLKAIENPYTNILGHPTGRLLLMRPGYPINHAYIIDACVANGVVIELNAHPYRLDLDWRWIDYAISKGALISINPDAHQKEGLEDMRYGVQVARKGYMLPEHCLNAMSLERITDFLEQKRKTKP